MLLLTMHWMLKSFWILSDCLWFCIFSLSFFIFRRFQAKYRTRYHLPNWSQDSDSIPHCSLRCHKWLNCRRWRWEHSGFATHGSETMEDFRPGARRRHRRRWFSVFTDFKRRGRRERSIQESHVPLNRISRRIFVPVALNPIPTRHIGYPSNAEFQAAHLALVVVRIALNVCDKINPPCRLDSFFSANRF